MTTLFLNLPLLQAAGGGTGQLVTTIATFGLVIVIFYFLIIRPQNKKQKETKKMLASIRKNDRVVTVGGVRGVVQSVKDETVVLKVDDNTKIEFSKSAISSILERKESKQPDTADTAEKEQEEK
ncbi:MAG: preprotein translocase subunit YajC [Spirochaetota bacterium]